VVGKPSLATAAASLLDVLGAATPAERGQVKALDQLNVPPGMLEVGRFPIRARLKQLSQVVEIVVPYLGPVYPLELTRPPAEGAAVALVEGIAAVLGLNGVSVHIEGEEPARSGVGIPPMLRVSERVARQPRSPVFRFWVGRALTAAATAGSMLERLSNSELGELIEALFATRPGAAAQQLRKQLNRFVPRKVRKQLEQVRIDHIDVRVWDHYRMEEQRRADMIGMLICGNPKVAVAELSAAEGVFGDFTRSPRVRELMTFAVSDQYAALHSAVWSGRRSERTG
jgi:hypothetical protein